MAPLPWRIEVCWELVWSEVSEREVSVRPSLALSEVEREGPHDSPALLLGDPGYFERKPSLAFTTLAQEVLLVPQLSAILENDTPSLLF
jgi:hypothetical protein